MEAAHVQFVPQLHYAIADYDSNDYLRGGVLYTDIRSGSVMMHVAGFRRYWASKSLLWLAFDYPFNMLKVKKIFAPVPEVNWRARHLDLHLGFKIECLLDDVYAGAYNDMNGMYVMSMKREDCRWLNMKRPSIVFASPEQTNMFERPTVH